jgi:hypothetical protein
VVAECYEGNLGPYECVCGLGINLSIKTSLATCLLAEWIDIHPRLGYCSV